MVSHGRIKGHVIIHVFAQLQRAEHFCVSLVIIPEEVGHDFRGMQVKLSRTIGKALFLLTWQVE